MDSKLSSSPGVLRREAPLLFLALGLFVFIQVSALFFHEPWVDEIQAWLLARDSTLIELLTARVRYESVPGLWHAVLWVVSRLSTDLVLLNICGALVASLSCALILFLSPLPLWMRLLLPFSYFFGYQYSVLARNYCLTTLGMLMAAIFYPKRFKHPFLYVLSLLIVANSATHGIILATVIALSDLPLKRTDLLKKASLLKLAPVFILGVIAALLQIYPRPLDFSSIPPQLALGWQVFLPSLSESLVGITSLSLIILGASIWLFYRARLLCLFLPSICFLEVLFVSTYWMAWHSGMIFLVWIFCVFQCYQRKCSAAESMWWKLTIATFLAVTIFQTVMSLQRDIVYPASGLKEAAQDLNRRNIDINDVVYIEFHSQMLRGYYPPVSGKPSYWTFYDAARQPWTLEHCYFGLAKIIRIFGLGSEYIYPRYVVSHDNTSAEAIMVSGYHIVKHYPGSLIWRGQGREHSGYYLISRL